MMPSRAIRSLVPASLVLIVGCCGRRPPDRGGHEERHDCAALLSEMDNTYRSCNSYEDSGTVSVMTLREGVGPGTIETANFETLFERTSGRFRFRYVTEAADEAPRVLAIWRLPPEPARTWAWFEPEVRDVDLERGIDAFRGVTDLAAWLVPSVLLEFRTSFRTVPLTIQGSEVVNGVPCWRLSSSGDKNAAIWISQTDHTLRRVFDRAHIQASPEDLQVALNVLPLDSPAPLRERRLREWSKPFVVETTIEYAPLLDRRIVASRFGDTQSPRDRSDE